ncbi:MAG TPA: four helix bundle protein [Candidatus Cloacimonetes bacterium]|nr:four helix bundle protein [Candidatus Cloacimonadota bacterium]
MKNNIIQDKSFHFSLTIIELYKILRKNMEYVIPKQLLRSSTSIGANIEEAIGAKSKKDFLAKMYISLKEAGETKYWLNLLDISQLVKYGYSSYLTKIIEIINVLKKSQKLLMKI